MWNRPAKYCPLCATPLITAEIEGREHQRCPDCPFVLYHNPATAAAGVVVDDAGRVLMVRRGIRPHRGSWGIPAGYQDIDEDALQAAVREVREESGAEVELVELLDVIFVPDDPRRPATVVVYLFRARAGELRPGSETTEACWFDLDELPEDIAFGNRENVLEPLRDHPLVRGLRESAVRPPVSRPATRAGSRPASPAGGSSSMTYRDAGVDIDAADAAMDRVKGAIRRTFTAGVKSDVGLFGGLFDPALVEAGGDLLVASADGVGTKLEIARRAGVYHTVGRDLVHHCIDDILVQGARPLFFMDYVGVGKMDPAVVSELIRGCAEACADNGLALLGGETAEMPGTYALDDFDLVGFIVGAVRPDALLDGSRVRPGQVLLGLASSGLHTNGYSLARKIAFEVLGLEVDDRPPELEGASVGEALLAPHRSYLGPLWPLVQEGRLAAMAHITGGGLRDNLPRVLGGCDAVLRPGSWPVPPVLRWLCEAGGIAEEERHRTFNMGIGMVLIVDPQEVAGVERSLRGSGEEVFAIGEVVAGEGRVRWGG